MTVSNSCKDFTNNAFLSPFFFNTCFILAFSLCKLSLFVILEYALLKKEGTTLSLQLVWW